MASITKLCQRRNPEGTNRVEAAFGDLSVMIRLVKPHFMTSLVFFVKKPRAKEKEAHVYLGLLRHYFFILSGTHFISL